MTSDESNRRHKQVVNILDRVNHRRKKTMEENSDDYVKLGVEIGFEVENKNEDDSSSTTSSALSEQEHYVTPKNCTLYNRVIILGSCLVAFIVTGSVLFEAVRFQ